jgi:lysophospholipase L1-like esterase
MFLAQRVVEKRREEKMRRIIAVLLLVLILAVPSFGQEFKETLGAVDMADGDTLVFLGDSITHQCLYTQYVEDYFYTRYPNRRIRLHNAGVSGDQANDALIRFDEDIAEFNPKYVTILIGMNDGHYTRFEHEIFDTYKKDMTTLLDKIEAIDATAILMHPTMFDLRPVLTGDKEFEGEEARQIHYNAVLAFFGAWGLQKANERGIGYVNMYEPLNRLTRERRKFDPTFTMIEDSVHPGPDGQLVMALALLNDIGAYPLVSDIRVDRQRRRWIVEADGGTLSDVKSKRISFVFTADSLPWVVPEEAQLGYRIADAGHRMSREALRVTGLTPGKYLLKIDGKRIGTFDHLQLAAGVELQGNTKTPQYAQALEVATLNKKRNDEAVRPMRNLWGRLKRYRERREEGEGDEPVPARLEEWRAEFPDKVAELHKRARELEDEIYRINKPQPRKYDIVSVE